MNCTPGVIDHGLFNNRYVGMVPGNPMSCTPGVIDHGFLNNRYMGVVPGNPIR